MRKTLSDKGVLALKAKTKAYTVPDPELRGMFVRVHKTGVKSYTAVTRNPAGKQIWTTIGQTDKLAIDETRTRARTDHRARSQGLPAFETRPTKNTFEDIAEQWLKRHVRAKGLRSEGEVTRLLKAHVYPRWHDRDILDIKRSHVAALLDHVEDKHGCTAGRRRARDRARYFQLVRDTARRLHPADRQGMRRTNAKERARARILDRRRTARDLEGRRRQRGIRCLHPSGIIDRAATRKSSSA